MELNQTLPPKLMAELQLAADSAALGVRSAEQMRQACAEMDRIRDEIYRQHGILEIGESAIREIRDRDE